MSDKRELIVQWSKHAIERVAERFGFSEREIPNKQITAAASQSKSGSIFKVYCAGIVYVVKRQKKSVLILTCFEDEHAGISRFAVRGQRWPSPRSLAGNGLELTFANHRSNCPGNEFQK